VLLYVEKPSIQVCLEHLNRRFGLLRLHKWRDLTSLADCAGNSQLEIQHRHGYKWGSLDCLIVSPIGIWEELWILRVVHNRASKCPWLLQRSSRRYRLHALWELQKLMQPHYHMFAYGRKPRLPLGNGSRMPSFGNNEWLFVKVSYIEVICRSLQACLHLDLHFLLNRGPSLQRVLC
jgi:hypothetical protein